MASLPDAHPWSSPGRRGLVCDSELCGPTAVSEALELPADRLPAFLLECLAEIPDPILLPIDVATPARHRAVAHDGHVEADQELYIVGGAECVGLRELSTNVTIALLDNLSVVRHEHCLELRICLLGGFFAAWPRRPRWPALSSPAGRSTEERRSWTPDP